MKRGHWSPIRVADLVKTGEAEVKTGPFGTQLHASDYVESGTSVINVRNIGFGGIRPEKLEYIADETVKRLSSHLLQSGDIVFGRKGAVERHVLIKAAQSNWFQGSDCLRLRLKTERVLPQFLSYYLLTHGHQQWMMQQCSHGATMASLNQDIVGRIEFLMPERAIQIRIASILSAYDDLIENNTRRIAILEEMARRLYEEWFVRFRFPGHEGVPMVESELDLVPQGWELTTFGRFIEFKKGKKPNATQPTPDGGAIPALLIDSLRGAAYEYTYPEKLVTVSVSDTIMVMDGSGSGEVFVGHEGAVGSTLGRYRASDECGVGPYWIYLFFAGNQADIRGKNVGAAIPHANKDYINLMPVVRPASHVAANFEATVEPMFALIRNFKMKNANLRTTRDLLLPKLISGELDVSTLPDPQAQTT